MAEIAGREAARRGDMAARLATRTGERQSRMAMLAVDSPEFSREIDALASEAVRMQTEYGQMNEAQRAQVRAEMHRHQRRIHELAEQTREQAHAMAQSGDDAEDNDNSDDSGDSN
jgi:hypothetical protein